MNNTITADEIREIRGMYDLSQRAFAQLLGIGTASMARYEGGAAPSKANANLIRAARHPEFMLECIQRDGDALSLRQRERATKCVYAVISLDPDEKDTASTEAVPNMDEVYHYTLQQEVLNEQAANLIGELISMKLSSSFIGEASDVFDDLLDQLAELKPEIVSEESMDDVKLASIGGYLGCARDLVRRRIRGAA